jgi:hypothetical protein
MIRKSSSFSNIMSDGVAPSRREALRDRGVSSLECRSRFSPGRRSRKLDAVFLPRRRVLSRAPRPAPVAAPALFARTTAWESGLSPPKARASSPLFPHREVRGSR